MKRILLMLVIALAGTNAFAANHYIRAGATGANNGTDWTNAWTSLSAVSWTRGDIYYIAAGNYGSYTFGAANSGTSTIEIRGAIGGTGDHGTATGWSDNYQGQALLSGGASKFTTNYWTVNGQAVPGCTYPSNNTACFTIKFVNPAVGNSPAAPWAIYLCDGSSFCTNYTLEYVDILGSNTTQIGGNFTDEGVYCYEQCTNVLFDHDYIHQVGCDLLSFNAFNGPNLTIQYSWLAYNDVGLGNISGSYAHCQGIQSTIATMVIRYSVWQDMQSSGAITLAAGGNGAPITEWDVYGNIFLWDAAWNAQWSGNGSVGYDDGIVGIFDETQGYKGGPLRIYNNTIVGLNLAASQNCNAQAYTINSGESVVATVYNNIWYDLGPNCNAGQAGPGTYDYNAYYQISNGTNDNGSHSYSSNTNPFVNPTALTLAGFALTADTQAGLQLASPYNVDLYGTARGASGVWDRGAIQLNGTSSSLPPVPQGLHVVSIQ